MASKPATPFEPSEKSFTKSSKSFTRDDGRRFNLNRAREDYASFETFMEEDGRGYAEGGLWIEGNLLVDYDGIFSLPAEVAGWLRDQGITVPKECVA